jgi:hypothetical protein
MSTVLIALCANGTPLANLQGPEDWSQYSRRVDLDDQLAFANAFTYYMGGAQALLNLPQFAGIEFTVEIESPHVHEEVEQIDKHLLYTAEYLKQVIPENAFVLDIPGWRIVASTITKH